MGVLIASTVVVLGQQAPQYHIQTDQGADRFFRFQTVSGQYRKEVRHEDGTQEGTYGWVDPNGVLRLFDYVADNLGYRIVQESLFNVGPANPDFSLKTRGGDLNLGFEVYPLDGGPGPAGRLGPDPSLPLLSCTLWTVAISILLAVTEPTPSSPPFLTRSTQTLWENRLEPRSSTSCLFLLLLHRGSSSDLRRWLYQPQRRGIALWLATLGNLPNPGQLLPLRGAG